MMRLSMFASVLLATSLLVSTPNPVSASADTACPVTKPDGKLQLSSDCPGNYGNNGLWVGLQPEIEFRPGGPGYVLRHGALEFKFAWCKQVLGKLSISGRRLDQPAPPLRSSFYAEPVEKGVVPSYVIFPTVGCWEVTGKVGDVSLTFVTRVTKVGKQK